MEDFLANSEGPGCSENWELFQVQHGILSTVCCLLKSHHAYCRTILPLHKRVVADGRLLAKLGFCNLYFCISLQVTPFWSLWRPSKASWASPSKRLSVKSKIRFSNRRTRVGNVLLIWNAATADWERVPIDTHPSILWKRRGRIWWARLENPKEKRIDAVWHASCVDFDQLSFSYLPLVPFWDIIVALCHVAKLVTSAEKPLEVWLIFAISYTASRLCRAFLSLALYLLLLDAQYCAPGHSSVLLDLHADWCSTAT